MDFYQAFQPIYILISLSFVKLLLFRGQFDLYIGIASFSGLIFARFANSYFDRDDKNDVSLWLVAIPLTTIFMCQAAINFKFVYLTTDLKSRIYYSLNNPLKKIWVLGNCFATVIYCICLFRWLWIIENNAQNKRGKIEDAEALHLAIGTSIFYAIFLIDRIGSYVLDIFHSQFFEEGMR